METIRFVQKTEADGCLSLRIPLGAPEAEYEVLVVVQPRQTSASARTSQEPGWPPGYFEKTYGSIEDETFFRHPQGELPRPVELN